mgnify:CR=1 FL=1
MAVEIKSGDGSDLQTVDPVSKAGRVTLYDSEGVEINQSLPVSIATVDVTVVDNDLIGSLDVSAYKFVSLQLTGTWAGTVKFQGSNDNGTFYNIAAQVPDGLATPYVTEVTAIALVKIPIVYKYFRVRVTAYTSGTVQGVALGYKEENATGQISSTGQVTLADANGLVAGPMLTDPSGQNHLPVAVIQDVFLSTANSTTANLDPAQIFYGTAESTKGINSIDFGAHADQNLTIEIEQGHSASTMDHSDSYSLAAGDSTLRNVKALAGFYRLKVTNTGGSATTGLHVNVALTPNSEVLPSSLSHEGHLKTAVSEALPAGTNKIGNVGISKDTELTDYYVSAAGVVGVNSRMLRAQACTLKAVVLMNTTATPRYVKLYDTATTPTAGAGTPVLVVALPAAGTLAFPLGLSGFDFANGIGMTMVLGADNNSVTATATVGDIVLMSVFT